MSLQRTPDVETPWAPAVSLVMILIFFAIAYLLVRYAPAPAGAFAPTAEASYPAADEHAAPTAVQVSASEMPRLETSPAPRDSLPPPHSEVSPPTPSEGVVIESRRALETVDPRELLRQGAVAPAALPQ